jgi:hypothetical protein
LQHAILNGHPDAPRQNVGHTALCPRMTDLRQAPDAARAIAAAALGRDPGPMATLREPLDHGGFVSQAALLAEVENLQCEVRDATYLASDLRVALEHPDARAGMGADRLRALEELIVGRYWWRHR